MTVVMGVLENRPIDAMVVAVLFMFVSIIAYIPFVGFLLCLSAATRIMDWFGYGGFVAVVYWIVTIWALIVYIASSALVVMRIIHRL
jgi:uncharacterized membrane protein (GlpM family)